MNFSVTGLDVQATNAIVVDDPAVAGMFATAFDVAFAGNVKASAFRQNRISKGSMVGSSGRNASCGQSKRRPGRSGQAARR
jgi:hypothetical protein